MHDMPINGLEEGTISNNTVRDHCSDEKDCAKHLIRLSIGSGLSKNQDRFDHPLIIFVMFWPCRR